MAPLDTGLVMNLRLVDPLGERIGPSPEQYVTVGEFLRAVREHKGQTLGELARNTRIRAAYLQGIEESDRSALPARPFAIGYVRSYAQALGIDGDAAAARFKREWPEAPELFHDPIGVAHDKPKRSPWIFAAVGVLLAGVVVWNVVQRATVQEDRTPSALLNAPAEPPPAPAKAVVAIGAPTPAPASQNLPTPYQTPFADKNGKPVDGPADPAANLDVAPPAAPPAVFAAKGPVYGAPAGPASQVVLQAVKPATLIVRGAGGAVYFARQLATGEAFRAPVGENLTAEVNDPAAFALYVSGEGKGTLVSQQTALDKLVSHADYSVAAHAAPVRSVTTPTVMANAAAAPQR